MDPTFKRIDTIPKLLEYVWSIFPNIIAIKKGKMPLTSNTIVVNKQIYTPMLENSVEFCDLLSKNVIKIQPFAQGGFGVVGTVTIDEDTKNQPLKAIIISIKRNGGFEPYYASVIVKISLSNETPTFSLDTATGVFHVSDPLSEMIFGSLLGHLYDLGICPFFTKYFGAYLCKGNKMGIITEKASVELKSLISRNSGVGIAQTHPTVIINLLFQYVYGLFIMKTFYGMVHFDTQHRNLMVSYVHNRLISLPLKIEDDYIYQGENLSKKDFFLLQVPTNNGLVFICIRNTGLLLKIIDYGVCSAFLNRSSVPAYKNDVIISSGITDFKRISSEIPFQKTLSSASYSNTVDLQYTLNNIWEHLSKGLDTHAGALNPDPNAPSDFKVILNQLDYFSEKFYDGSEYRLSNLMNQNPHLQVQIVQRKRGKGLAWVSYVHDTGFEKNSFDNPSRLLTGLVNVCVDAITVPIDLKGIQFKEAKIYYFEPDIPNLIRGHGTLTNVNSVILQCSVSQYEKNLNQFNQLISNSNLFRDTCATETEKKTVMCKNIQLNTLKYSLSSVASKKLYSPYTTSLNSNNLIKRTAIFDYHQIQINPRALNSPINAPGAQVYQEYQNWLDFKTIKKSKIGEYVEIIFLHVFRLRSGLKSIKMDKQMDLWEGVAKNFSEKGTALAVNCGYFITPGNVNYLAPNLSEKDVFKPIGFYYDASFIENGTVLSFPSPYHEDLAFIYGKGSQIEIQKYADFMSRHETINHTVRLEIKDGEHPKIFEETVKAIAMTSSTDEESTSIIGSKPLKIGMIEQNDYDWAFCSGPILIWDGKVVFTETKMNSELMTVNSNGKEILVSAVPGAKNSYKFRADENEGNQWYGMRHSFRYMIHNVLAFDSKNRPYFIFSEGRGFDSPGLDRVQLSNIILSLDIKRAVSLDGGFSANAIYKACDSSNQCKPIFALNDPEKRKLGISLYMT